MFVIISENRQTRTTRFYVERAFPVCLKTRRLYFNLIYIYDSIIFSRNDSTGTFRTDLALSYVYDRIKSRVRMHRSRACMIIIMTFSDRRRCRGVFGFRGRNTRNVFATIPVRLCFWKTRTKLFKPRVVHDRPVGIL